MKKFNWLMLCAAVIFNIFNGNNVMAKEMDIPLTHRAILQEDVWLNTNRALTSEDLKNRIILLDFWTFCCINCIHVMPDLKKLEQEFGDKLLVIGVHSAKFANEKDTSSIRQAIVKYGLEHPVVNDANFIIWRSFGTNSWPTFVLIDPNGEVVAAKSGEGHYEFFQSEIKKLVKKYDNVLSKAKLPIDLEKNKEPETTLKFPGKIELANIDGTDYLFIADTAHNRILQTLLDGSIVNIIGSGKAKLIDGNFANAAFNNPQGIIYKNGVLYVADTENHALRAVHLKNMSVETLAGNGMQGSRLAFGELDAAKTKLSTPWDLSFNGENNILIAMAGTHQLWQYNIKDKTIANYAGNGREYIDDGKFPFNSLSQPSGLSYYNGNTYFADSETSSLRVVNNKGSIETLIGKGLFDFGLIDGNKSVARMQHPLGVYADETGVYMADTYNHAIRFYNYTTKELSTLLTTGLDEPNDVIKKGNELIIADTNHHAIKVFNLTTKELNSINVEEEFKATELQEILPNVGKWQAANFSSTSANKIVIELSNDWKINNEAPSWLTVFVNNKVYATFATSNLKGLEVEFEKLNNNDNVQVQGTLYYCRKDGTGVCLIESLDSKTSVSENANNVQNIKLKTE